MRAGLFHLPASQKKEANGRTNQIPFLPNKKSDALRDACTNLITYTPIDFTYRFIASSIQNSSAINQLFTNSA
jgi:hypothetical protein